MSPFLLKLQCFQSRMPVILLGRWGPPSSLSLLQSLPISCTSSLQTLVWLPCNYGTHAEVCTEGLKVYAESAKVCDSWAWLATLLCHLWWRIKSSIGVNSSWCWAVNLWTPREMLPTCANHAGQGGPRLWFCRCMFVVTSKLDKPIDNTAL